MERLMDEWGELTFFLCDSKGSYKYLAISDTWVVVYKICLPWFFHIFQFIISQFEQSPESQGKLCKGMKL